MKRRPWPLVILAILHILAPIGNKMVAIYMAHMPVNLYLKIIWFQASKVMTVLSVALPICAGILIFICRKWSLYLYMACMALILLLSVKAALTYGNYVSLALVVVMTVADLLIVSYFMLPIVRSIYMDPRMRWWETAQRFRLETEIRYAVNGQSFVGITSNFSQTGLFISSEHAPPDGSSIEVSFTYREITFLSMGKVIHHGQMNRLGFGVQFELNAESRKAGQKMVSLLEEDGLGIADRLPGPEDSFASWVKTFLTTGKGIVPVRSRK